MGNKVAPPGALDTWLRLLQFYGIAIQIPMSLIMANERAYLYPFICTHSKNTYQRLQEFIPFSFPIAKILS